MSLPRTASGMVTILAETSKDGVLPHGVPGEDPAMILSHQALHEDGQMREGIVRRDIAQLVAFAQLQEQMKQIGAETQALFAPIAITVDQKRLPVEKLQPLFTAIREVGFEAEVAVRISRPRTPSRSGVRGVICSGTAPGRSRAAREAESGDERCRRKGA